MKKTIKEILAWILSIPMIICILILIPLVFILYSPLFLFKELTEGKE